MKDYFALIGMTGLLLGTSLFIGAGALTGGKKNAEPAVADANAGMVDAETETQTPQQEPDADPFIDPPTGLSSETTSETSVESSPKPMGEMTSKSTNKPVTDSVNSVKNPKTVTVMSEDKPKQEAEDEELSRAEQLRKWAKDREARRKALAAKIKADRAEKEAKQKEANKNRENGSSESQDSVKAGEDNGRDIGEIGPEVFEIDVVPVQNDAQAAPLTLREMLQAPPAKLAKVIADSDGPTPNELHGTWEVVPCHGDGKVAGKRSFSSIDLKVNNGAYYETVQYYIDKEKKQLGPQTSTTLYVKVSDKHMLAVIHPGTPHASYSVLNKISDEIAELEKSAIDKGSEKGTKESVMAKKRDSKNGSKRAMDDTAKGSDTKGNAAKQNASKKNMSKDDASKGNGSKSSKGDSKTTRPMDSKLKKSNKKPMSKKAEKDMRA